ncbi:MAG TPA: hypothetical protein PK450_03335 [Paracoccaceae bacterium]|nr:hypothetical protein [Paracoccaceae bacterium]
MTQTDWLQLLARITPDHPTDLDDLHPVPAARRGGSWAVASITSPAGPIWARLNPGGTIGVRITRPLKDTAHAAARLAAAAVERDVTPIILSSLPLSGFEQYGFRVERLPEGPEAEVQAFEQELTEFWSLAVIVNAADIDHLD